VGQEGGQAKVGLGGSWGEGGGGLSVGWV